jgi:RNA polymerase sigma factor (TIGR02999 family)
MSDARGNVTTLLHDWQAGNEQALEKVTRLVYAELHRLASSYLRRERAGHTLQPTALISEAYLRLCGGDGVPDLTDRAHFIAIAARTMRQILVDHARRRDAEKRGAGEVAVTFEESLVGAAESRTVIALDDAIAELEKVDPRKANIVVLVYFGGLEQGEVAKLLGVHVNTVARDLRLARAWIKTRIA